MALPAAAHALMRAQMRGVVDAMHTAELFRRALVVFNPQLREVTRLAPRDEKAMLEAIGGFVRTQILDVVLPEATGTSPARKAAPSGDSARKVRSGVSRPDAIRASSTLH